MINCIRFRSIAIAILVGTAGFALPSKAQPAPAATVPVLHEPAAPTIARGDDGSVTLRGDLADTTILYSLDGSDPNSKSSPYLAPIDLSHGGTIKARAFTNNRTVKSPLSTEKFPPLPGMQPVSSTIVATTQDRSWNGYDWAKRHGAVCAAIRARQPALIFVGDSITHFWGGEPSDLNPWGAKVWQQFYEPYHAVDAGFGWDRTENALWRVQHGEIDSDTLKVAIVMIGTNNIGLNKPADVAAGVQAVCDAIHDRRPTAKILLLAIFPRGQKPGPDRDKVTEVNRLLATRDGQHGITFLDIGEHFLSPDGSISPDIMHDALHPTAKGYQIWADAMQPTLKKLMTAQP